MAHMTAVETLAARMNQLNIPTPEQTIIGKILSSVPREYHVVGKIFEAQPKALQTLDDLRTRLAEEEDSLKAEEDKKSRLAAATRDAAASRDEDALAASGHYDSFARGKGNSRGRGRGLPGVKPSHPYHPPGADGTQQSHKIQRCDYCHGRFHTATNCRYKARDEKAGQEQQSSSKSAAPKNVSFKDSDAFISSACFRALKSGRWIADSGASEHMTDSRSSFLHFTPLEAGSWRVNGVGGAKLSVMGTGTVVIKNLLPGGTRSATLNNVLYVPGLGGDLLSLGAVTDLDIEVRLTKHGIKLERDGLVLMTGVRDPELKGLYYMDIATVPQSLPDTTIVYTSSTAAAVKVTSKAASEGTIDDWHRRLAHVNYDAIEKMERVKAVTGMKITHKNRPPNGCEACDKGKMTRRPFSLGRRRGTFVGERIHGDLVGPIEVPTPNGARFYLILKDDYSTFKEAFFLKSKSDAPFHIKAFIAKVERETSNSVLYIRCDNGGEFVSGDLCDWLFERGIQQETSVPHTPQQNGVSERDHRTTCGAMRSELHAMDLPPSFWAEAIKYSVDSHNRSLSSVTPGNKTPFEIYYGRKPDVSHMQEFGSKVRVFIPDVERRKLDARCHNGIFLGYDSRSDGYRIFDVEDKKTRISRDVKFLCGNPESSVDFSAPPVASLDTVDNEVVSMEVVEPRQEYPTLPSVPLRRSPRGRQPKRHWPGDEGTSEESDDEEDACAAFIVEPEPGQSFGYLYQEPRNMKEARASQEWPQWWASMVDEVNSLKQNGTWDLVRLPPGSVPIPCRFDFKVKRGRDGEVNRFKSRLVIQGFRQVYGIDYTESFSPVVRYSTLRILLAFAAALDLPIYHIDVKTAFLHAPLKETIFMCQPEGFVDPDKPTYVCRLRKSLYGLIQAPREWNELLHNFLTSFGLQRSSVDPCLYVRIAAGVTTLAAFWVDDGLIMSTDPQECINLVNALAVNVEVSSKPADHFVGLNIDRDRGNRKLYLSCPSFIEKLLAKFQMSQCHPLTVPADPHTRLSKAMAPQTPVERDRMQKVPFRMLVGSLMYIATTFRPDIAFAVNVVARFCQNPGNAHWQAAKRIARYLAGTCRHGLCFSGGAAAVIELTGFSDADFAGDLDSRRSTTGWAFLINGTAVSWRSKRQTCVALSTTEAEYISASSATQEAICCRRVLGQCGHQQSGPTRLYVDNQSAIRIVKNPEFHERTKHIEVKYHYIRDQYQRKEISVHYVNTKEQIADIFTKPLAAADHQKFKTALGVIEVP